MTMPSVDGSFASVRPPRWAEAALRLLLRRDVAETVSGDLLEEYREVVQPLRGTWRADVWFVRQVGGFVWQATWLPVTIGLLLGAGLGVLNLFETARHPLEEDDAGALLLWVIAVSGVWSAAAGVATWRTHRFAEAIRVGTIVGAMTILALHVSSIVRVNLFLDLIRDRGDWQNLIVRFNGSGFRSLRTYANYEYVKMTPFVILLGALLGSISGALGGAVMLVKGRA
jgi:hypothetical protein